MPIVFQVAGKLRTGEPEGLKRAFAAAEAVVEGQPGFQAARLLASYPTRQMQVLFYWDTYEQGLAFHQGGYPRIARALAASIEPQGTLITSVLESRLG